VTDGSSASSNRNGRTAGAPPNTPSRPGGRSCSPDRRWPRAPRPDPGTRATSPGVSFAARSCGAAAATAARPARPARDDHTDSDRPNARWRSPPDGGVRPPDDHVAPPLSEWALHGRECSNSVSRSRK
jgi:hypothetical protein